MFEATEEQIDWFFCFTQTFEKLNQEKLASGRLVVDNKILKWSTKLIGYYHCSLCQQTFNSINSQVEFHYRIVPKHRRGELRVYKQYGQMCRKCHGMEYIVPKIDSDDKLYAMECLLVKVMYFFYNEHMDMPQRIKRPQGQGDHHTQGCEACLLQVCRCNPLFKGILVDQSIFPRPPADENPRVIGWKIYFGNSCHPFELSFEDRCAYERIQQEQRAPVQSVQNFTPSSEDSRREGLFSTSDQSDASVEDEQEHGERMSQGDGERTVFSSRASSVCGDMPAGSNTNDNNNQSKCENTQMATGCSSAPINVTQIHQSRPANAKPARPELTTDNFDSIYNSIFSVK